MYQAYRREKVLDDGQVPQRRDGSVRIVRLGNQPDVQVVRAVVRVVDLGAAKRQDGEIVRGRKECLRARGIPLARVFAELCPQRQPGQFHVFDQFVIGHAARAVACVAQHGGIRCPGRLRQITAGREGMPGGHLEVRIFVFFRGKEQVFQGAGQ